MTSAWGLAFIERENTERVHDLPDRGGAVHPVHAENFDIHCVPVYHSDRR